MKMVTWKDMGMDLFFWLRVAAENDQQKNIITTDVKNNGFNRAEQQIERKKKELGRSYGPVMPHLDKLDAIFWSKSARLTGNSASPSNSYTD